MFTAHPFSRRIINFLVSTNIKMSVLNFCQQCAEVGWRNKMATIWEAGIGYQDNDDPFILTSLCELSNKELWIFYQTPLGDITLNWQTVSFAGRFKANSGPHLKKHFQRLFRNFTIQTNSLKFFFKSLRLWCLIDWLNCIHEASKNFKTFPTIILHFLLKTLSIKPNLVVADFLPEGGMMHNFLCRSV